MEKVIEHDPLIGKNGMRGGIGCLGKIAVNIPVVKVMFLIRVKNAVIREINNV